MKRMIAALCSFAILAASVTASKCDQSCLSYCAYYYPSESCIEKCECPEYAAKQKYHTSMRMTEQVLKANSTATVHTTDTTTTTTKPGTNTTTPSGTNTTAINQPGGKNTTVTDPVVTTGNQTSTGGQTNTTDPNPVKPVDPVDPVDKVDPIDPVDPIIPVDPIDPAMEESKQTCITTCNLKCKSESSAKKDDCINLCFN